MKKKVLESLKLVETFLVSYITDDTVLDQKAKSQCHESSLLMMSRFMTFVNVLSGVDTCKLQAALDYFDCSLGRNVTAAAVCGEV